MNKLNDERDTLTIKTDEDLKWEVTKAGYYKCVKCRYEPPMSVYEMQGRYFRFCPYCATEYFGVKECKE